MVLLQISQRPLCARTFAPHFQPLSDPDLHQTQLLASLNRHLDAGEKQRIIHTWITAKLDHVSKLLAKWIWHPELAHFSNACK